jgi:hypothetical protein
MKALLLTLCCVFAASAQAKLPAPSDEAKAKADLTKAENGHKDKIAAFQLCKSQDVAAKKYYASAIGKGKKADAAPPCADPGAFVPPPPASVAAAPAAPAVAAPAAAPAAAPVAKK